MMLGVLSLNPCLRSLSAPNGVQAILRSKLQVGCFASQEPLFQKEPFIHG